MLLRPDRHGSGASVQRRYIEAGKFDFCIEDGERVAQLTSDPNGWPNIEAGQKIVMRSSSKKWCASVMYLYVVNQTCEAICQEGLRSVACNQRLVER